MQLITVPLEIGFGQSSAHVQDLENLQLHQQPLQLPQQPPPLLQQQQKESKKKNSERSEKFRFFFFF